MSILVDKESRVVVQGVTGKEGSFHTRQMLEYGTKVVAGVTPGKAGQQVEGVPVYHTVADAVAEQGANVSIIFVPPAFAPDAIMEAAAAGIAVIACITEGLPTLDMVRVKHYLKGRSSVLIGPNCPGIITPGACKLGIMPGYIFQPGPIGVISRSGTLTYEVVDQISKQGLGQSTCLGIGGDPIIGLNFIDLLKLFAEDPQTGGVVLIGEIGGTAEEEAAAFIKEHFSKPVVTFIAGQTAPPGRRMGHAGAIISGKSGTAQEKMAVLKAAGIRVVVDLTKVGEAVKELMGSPKTLAENLPNYWPYETTAAHLLRPLHHLPAEGPAGTEPPGHRLFLQSQHPSLPRICQAKSHSGGVRRKGGAESSFQFGLRPRGISIPNPPLGAGPLPGLLPDAAHGCRARSQGPLLRGLHHYPALQPLPEA